VNIWFVNSNVYVIDYRLLQVKKKTFTQSTSVQIQK